ncbi:MAG: Holliday junction branch migration DNA helicase RuvB [candidate division Zixibacteria bacterium]|nr:Holliday junction branch migration DNA helicase RuvB [candidate division Zixibacteria bacterium]
MKRERIVSPESATPEEEKTFLSLRPTALDECIGQKNLLDKMRLSIEAAQRRQEPHEHMLFYGPPGLGKTTLANILAKEMGANIVSTSGPTLTRSGDLMGILTNLKHGDVLFIDEIHRLNPVVEEFIYPALEDFRVEFLIDKGAFSRVINMPLKQFTMVGATTRAGMLSAPLRDRFGIYHHIDFYEDGDLAEIATRSANLLKVDIDNAGAAVIGQRSRGTPRIANRLLRRVRDYCQVKGDGFINADIAKKALQLEGIDKIGLDKLDRSFIKIIIDYYKGGPVGIETIATTLNEESDTLVDMVEPYLLKIGLIQRTRQGRIATAKAYDHLGIKRGETSGPQESLF